MRAKWFLAVGVVCAAMAAQAVDPGLEFRRQILSANHVSISGQFIAHDAPVTSVYAFNNRGNATNLVRLQPDFLVVSCERIKQALLLKLGARDEWRGKITLDLHHCIDPSEALVVEPMLFEDGWHYRIQLPDVLDRSRLVTVMVQVLMLEMANRNSANPVEIPTWLAEGMAREVILSNPNDLVVDAPGATEHGVTVARLTFDNRQDAALGKKASDWTDPLADAHYFLSGTPPLTLDELSWPAAGELDGDRAEAYRYSAQLLVHDLLKLPDGGASLQAMLRAIPQHLNWQLTFLQAFHAEFKDQLAVDKWWMLQVADFTGRDFSKMWSPAESWNRLDDLLHPIVETRASIAAPTLHGRTTLQSVLRDWDVLRQDDLFREKSRQLFMLRTRVSQELVYLVDAYRGALDAYLRERSQAVYVPMGRTVYAPRVDNMAHDMIRRLDELDAQREQLRPKAAPALQAVPAISASN